LSSLTRLRQLPADKVKIDCGFIAGMVANNEDIAVVASVVHLATMLRHTRVAEGAESFEQVKLLQQPRVSGPAGIPVESRSPA
jgi:EAL domain-containing protein (putative c-di-GMP-specific phosphodiesterase class I)